MKYLISILFFILLQGCAGINPNPGERTFDHMWASQRYDSAVNLVKEPAENGKPWAQIRLAQAYFFGEGVPKDKALAVEWYKKAAVQKSDTGWANGQIVGATGDHGWFGQNTDATVAQYQLALIYYEGDQVPQNIEEARYWINEATQNSKGQHVYICCAEITKNGYWITQGMIQKLDKDIEILENKI